MTATRYRPWIAALLLSLMAVNAGAAEVGQAAPGAAMEHAGEGRSGWDAVGSKARDTAVAAGPASVRPAAGSERYQARKREMVRRMFMLMVAYR